MKKIIALFLALIVAQSGLSLTAFAKSFTDIDNDSHKDAIEYLQSKNLVKGYADGTFKPKQILNRAELLKLAILATDANGKFSNPTFAPYQNCFPDVQDQWFAAYVCFSKSQGWIQGYADGKFHPEREVTKAEALKMIVKANELKEFKTETQIFEDVPQNSWYFTYVHTASRHHLLEEAKGNYYPSTGMNRSALAEILYRLLTGKKSVVSSNEKCQPLSTTTGVEIKVSTVAELRVAAKDANENGNTTILLEDGIYNFTGEGIWLSGNNIVIRSESGNREKVILNGEGMQGSTTRIFFLAGDNITIADMSLGSVANHVIQVHGELDADGAVLHNLHIKDSYEQLVKVSYDSSKMGQSSDNGILECSTLEYTAGIGPQYYIGGIDAHNAKNWTVDSNTFKGIRSPEELLAEHAIHFWSDSKNTLVENNTILNCDRGIGFGLGEDRGAHGGIIRENNIYHDSSRGDVGIILESANDVTIQDNIILMENDYPNAIEYRFKATTGAQILNNTSNKAIKLRDGATGTLFGNITNAKISDYKNPSQGDFTKL